MDHELTMLLFYLNKSHHVYLLPHKNLTVYSVHVYNTEYVSFFEEEV